MVAGLMNMPRSHVFWLAPALLFGLLSIVFYAVYLSNGDEERERAIASGQRLLVNLATGEIEGKMQQLFPDALPDEGPTAADGNVDYEGAESHSSGSDEPLEAADPADPYAEFTAGLAETMHGTPDEEGDEWENPTDTAEATLGKPQKAAQPVPVFPRTVASLEPVNQSYMQNSEHGMLPDRNSKDQKPWEFYARKSTAPKSAPKIAIAISHLGAHHHYGREALKLPQDVSFIFTNYSPDAPKWLESARNRGHEAWLQLPVQMNNYPASDPGPLGLTTDLSQAETMRRLHKNLARLQAYSGVYFPPNEKFTKQGILAQLVLSDIRGRGLLALIGNRDTTADWAQRYRGAVLPRATHISPPYNAKTLIRNLESIARKAVADRSLIVTIEPTPLALQTLQEWLPTLTKQGIALVPLSAMMQQ